MIIGKVSMRWSNESSFRLSIEKPEDLHVLPMIKANYFIQFKFRSW